MKEYKKYVENTHYHESILELLPKEIIEKYFIKVYVIKPYVYKCIKSFKLEIEYKIEE